MQSFKGANPRIIDFSLPVESGSGFFLVAENEPLLRSEMLDDHSQPSPFGPKSDGAPDLRYSSKASSLQSGVAPTTNLAAATNLVRWLCLHSSSIPSINDLALLTCRRAATLRISILARPRLVLDRSAPCVGNCANRNISMPSWEFFFPRRDRQPRSCAGARASPPLLRREVFGASGRDVRP